MDSVSHSPSRTHAGLPAQKAERAGRRATPLPSPAAHFERSTSRTGPASTPTTDALDRSLGPEDQGVRHTERDQLPPERTKPPRETSSFARCLVTRSLVVVGEGELGFDGSSPARRPTRAPRGSRQVRRSGPPRAPGITVRHRPESAFNVTGTRSPVPDGCADESSLLIPAMRGGAVHRAASAPEDGPARGSRPTNRDASRRSLSRSGASAWVPGPGRRLLQTASPSRLGPRLRGDPASLYVVQQSPDSRPEERTVVRPASRMHSPTRNLATS